MGGRLLTIALIVFATFAVAPMASALDDPALTEYVGQVEPICEANTEASHHILAGAQQRVNKDKLEPAGKQFARAAAAFSKSTRQLEAVPRPPAYETKLTKWFSHLDIVDSYLLKISKALKSGNKLKATYEVVKLRSSANSTNNVVFDIDFRYCRLTESRFK